MEAIVLGNITRGVRVEVIGAVAVQMLQYTTTPTSQVCVHMLNLITIHFCLRMPSQL